MTSMYIQVDSDQGIVQLAILFVILCYCFKKTYFKVIKMLFKYLVNILESERVTNTYLTKEVIVLKISNNR